MLVYVVIYWFGDESVIKYVLKVGYFKNLFIDKKR